MTREQYLKNLQVPSSKVDVVLDTDAYNEIDDQFAIAYLLRSGDKLNTKAIYAAPFHNDNSNGAADGMERSYREILKLLELMGETRDVFRGADAFLADEKSPVISAAAEDLVRRAEKYSPEKPLYVVAIGAITNVASAILLNPKVAENTVVVWLGGHARHYHNTEEFNMRGDIAAARKTLFHFGEQGGQSVFAPDLVGMGAVTAQEDISHRDQLLKRFSASSLPNFSPPRNIGIAK